MTPPAWGIPVVVVVGALVVVLGTLWDRARYRRAEAELARAVPGPATATAAAPAGATATEPVYTHEVDLAATPLSADEAAELDLLGRRGEASTLPGGAPDGRFLNHPRRGVAILLSPTVLVTDADVTGQRDLATVLAAARRRGRPLVWVARGFGPEVVAGLRANAVTQRVPNLPIELDDPTHLRRAVAYTGGRLVSAADLAADWLPKEVWGTCAGWVATLDDSWVVPQKEPDAPA